MSIKKQLAAYYDKQGLTGKHRRKAMQYDMKAVRENIKACRHGSRQPRLSASFVFHSTPQGERYWYARG